MLTRKDIKFCWSTDCQEAFDVLKSKLCSAPILAYPNFDVDFVLETDASGLGLGAVLSQHANGTGSLHPVAFASRALSPSERNYSITDLETLAIVWACSHFRAYLYGHTVTVYTDHLAAKTVIQSPSLNGKHARWWTKIYSSGIKKVTIVYRPGKDNARADSLSRNPVSPAVLSDTDDIVQVAMATTEPQAAATKSHHSGICVDITNVTWDPSHSPVYAITNEKSTQVTDLLLSELLQREPTTTPDMDTFKELQRKDSYLAPLIAYLENDELPVDSKESSRIQTLSKHLVMLSGLLYYVDVAPHSKNVRQRVAVPKQCQQHILQCSHGGFFAGHFAGKRLYSLLCKKWWWEHMYSDAIDYCRSCPSCVTVTGGGQVTKPPLCPIPVERPFQILGVDIMKLPKTASGNSCALVFQDYLSKWPMVFAIPDQKSSRIVQILVNDVMPLIGIPEALLSDRGTNLLSYIMKDVCSLLGIKKLNTTAYHPQCDGLVERFNRTLKTMLRKHVTKYGNQWDAYLSAVVWAYRNTPHEATGEKPSFLLYGIDCRTPAEAMYLPPTELTTTNTTDYRKELVSSLTSARQLAAANIQKAQQRYKIQYDKTTKPTSYSAGDRVLIHFPQDEAGPLRKLSRP